MNTTEETEIDISGTMGRSDEETVGLTPGGDTETDLVPPLPSDKTKEETALLNDTVLQGSMYKITKVLGQGGFGITYAGIQTSLNRPVAIKEFYMREFCSRDASMTVTYTRTDKMDTVQSFQQKFLKEARLIADLQHSNIVKIIDVFEENNTAYYVMEHIAGGSLQDYVEQHGPLPEQKALSIIRQVASALDHVHQHKILHLDVKPANVMLRDDGTAVLIDFGISKHYTDSGTQTTTSLGGISRGYAPMEQYLEGGVAQFSPATDIYSMGAVLYFMLTGQRPPEAQTIFNEGLPALPQSLSKPTQGAVIAAMHPQRKDRPQSVTDFLAIIDGNKAIGEPTAAYDYEDSHIVAEDSASGFDWGNVLRGILLYFVLYIVVAVVINVPNEMRERVSSEQATKTYELVLDQNDTSGYGKCDLVHVPTGKKQPSDVGVICEYNGYALLGNDEHDFYIAQPTGEAIAFGHYQGRYYVYIDFLTPDIIWVSSQKSESGTDVEDFYDLSGKPVYNLTTFSFEYKTSFLLFAVIDALLLAVILFLWHIWRKKRKPKQGRDQETEIMK